MEAEQKFWGRIAQPQILKPDFDTSVILASKMIKYFTFDAYFIKKAFLSQKYLRYDLKVKIKNFYAPSLINMLWQPIGYKFKIMRRDLVVSFFQYVNPPKSQFGNSQMQPTTHAFKSVKCKKCKNLGTGSGSVKFELGQAWIASDQCVTCVSTYIYIQTTPL